MAFTCPHCDWTDELTSTPAATVAATQRKEPPMYDQDDRCTSCGEHIADPHAPECPAELDTREDHP